MCGICGIVSLRGEAVPEGAVRAMNDAMVHRGPDGEGYHRRRRVTVGMRRLAIIDVEHGQQPLYNEEGTVAVVFNGEIYNYRELRRELRGRGHRFLTESDTEVLVHGYEEWGEELLPRLRGIFGLAVVDGRREGPESVLLARDPLGVKPLYLWRDEESLVFASEVRAVLASGRVPRTLDPAGLRSYLLYGSVQDPWTLVEGVGSLPPGGALRVGPDGLRAWRFWTLPDPSAVRASMDAPAMEAEAAGLLTDAVESQLVADVPLGVFLSGGIDSTAIAALMRAGSAAPVASFAIVFEEDAYDERRWARLAADHIGTEHHELLVTGRDAAAELDRALGCFDQPSTDGLNTYFVSGAVRRAGLKVALSGVGGDELFGGYGGYRRSVRMDRWAARARRLPESLRRAAAAALAPLPGETTGRVADLLGHEGPPYFLARRFLSRGGAREILGPELAADPGPWLPDRFSVLADETRGFDPVNRISALELRTYMLSTLLRDTDQMSMAHSLEVRVPLVDPELVAGVLTMPGPLKVGGERPKPVLTGALGVALPRGCVHRPKKGFEFPLDRWLRVALRERMAASFTPADEAGAWPFSPGALARLWRGFEDGRITWSRVWGIFVLREWLREQGIGAG